MNLHEEQVKEQQRDLELEIIQNKIDIEYHEKKLDYLKWKSARLDWQISLIKQQIAAEKEN